MENASCGRTGTRTRRLNHARPERHQIAKAIDKGIVHGHFDRMGILGMPLRFSVDTSRSVAIALFLAAMLSNVLPLRAQRTSSATVSVERSDNRGVVLRVSG